MNGELIELANRLGVASEQLIEWYVLLAPWQWLWAAMSATMMVVCSLGALACYRWYLRVERTAEDEGVPGFVTVVLVAFALIWLLATCLDIKKAVEATVSPEAFAVSEILEALGK